MLYDTHCHPYLAKSKNQEEIFENFFSAGGKYLNSIGCDIESSITCIDLAKKHAGVFATIGIHPTHTIEYKDSLDQTITNLEKMYGENSNHIVAIGEIGLDYYWLESLSKQYNISKEEIITLQKEFFIAQIQLAKKLTLPVVIHNRESSKEIFGILEQESFTNFVFHCYSEDREYAEKLITFAPNCKLGFGGVTTFKNAHSIQEVVKHIPINNIMIETDSPYLTPVPHRGKQENEPIYTKHVLSTIIDLRDEDSEFISKEIFQNSLDFFGIKNKSL